MRNLVGKAGRLPVFVAAILIAIAIVAAMGRPGPRVRVFAAAVVFLTRSGVAG